MTLPPRSTVNPTGSRVRLLAIFPVTLPAVLCASLEALAALPSLLAAPGFQ